MKKNAVKYCHRQFQLLENFEPPSSLKKHWQLYINAICVVALTTYWMYFHGISVGAWINSFEASRTLFFSTSDPAHAALASKLDNPIKLLVANATDYFYNTPASFLIGSWLYRAINISAIFFICYKLIPHPLLAVLAGVLIAFADALHVGGHSNLTGAVYAYYGSLSTALGIMTVYFFLSRRLVVATFLLAATFYIRPPNAASLLILLLLLSVTPPFLNELRKTITHFITPFVIIVSPTLLPYVFEIFSFPLYHLDDVTRASTTNIQFPEWHNFLLLRRPGDTSFSYAFSISATYYALCTIAYFLFYHKPSDDLSNKLNAAVLLVSALNLAYVVAEYCHFHGFFLPFFSEALVVIQTKRTLFICAVIVIIAIFRQCSLSCLGWRLKSTVIILLSIIVLFGSPTVAAFFTILFLFQNIFFAKQNFKISIIVLTALGLAGFLANKIFHRTSLSTDKIFEELISTMPKPQAHKKARLPADVAPIGGNFFAEVNMPFLYRLIDAPYASRLWGKYDSQAERESLFDVFGFITSHPQNGNVIISPHYRISVPYFTGKPGYISETKDSGILGFNLRHFGSYECRLTRLFGQQKGHSWLYSDANYLRRMSNEYDNLGSETVIKLLSSEENTFFVTKNDYSDMTAIYSNKYFHVYSNKSLGGQITFSAKNEPGCVK